MAAGGITALLALLSYFDYAHRLSAIWSLGVGFCFLIRGFVLKSPTSATNILSDMETHLMNGIQSSFRVANDFLKSRGLAAPEPATRVALEQSPHKMVIHTEIAAPRKSRPSQSKLMFSDPLGVPQKKEITSIELTKLNEEFGERLGQVYGHLEAALNQLDAQVERWRRSEIELSQLDRQWNMVFRATLSKLEREIAQMPLEDTVSGPFRRHCLELIDAAVEYYSELVSATPTPDVRMQTLEAKYEQLKIQARQDRAASG